MDYNNKEGEYYPQNNDEFEITPDIEEALYSQIYHQAQDETRDRASTEYVFETSTVNSSGLLVPQRSEVQSDTIVIISDAEPKRSLQKDINEGAKDNDCVITPSETISHTKQKPTRAKVSKVQEKIKQQSKTVVDRQLSNVRNEKHKGKLKKLLVSFVKTLNKDLPSKSEALNTEGDDSKTYTNTSNDEKQALKSKRSKLNKRKTRSNDSEEIDNTSCAEISAQSKQRKRKQQGAKNVDDVSTKRSIVTVTEDTDDIEDDLDTYNSETVSGENTATESDISSCESNNSGDVDDLFPVEISLNLKKKTKGKQFGLQKILDSLEDCDWSLIRQDVQPARILGRGKAFQGFCMNCQRRGHLSKVCPNPKNVPACIFCGQRGHTYRACSDAHCFNCNGPLSKHDEGCPFPRRSKHYKCRTCKLPGHSERECPNIWRQFHKTTKPDDLQEGDLRNNVNKKVYCVNCSGRGHFDFECHLPTMNHWQLPISPFVWRYDLAEELARITEAQETRPHPAHRGPVATQSSARDASAGLKSRNQSTPTSDPNAMRKSKSCPTLPAFFARKHKYDNYPDDELDLFADNTPSRRKRNRNASKGTSPCNIEKAIAKSREKTNRQWNNIGMDTHEDYTPSRKKKLPKAKFSGHQESQQWEAKYFAELDDYFEKEQEENKKRKKGLKRLKKGIKDTVRQATNRFGSKRDLDRNYGPTGEGFKTGKRKGK